MPFSDHASYPRPDSVRAIAPSLPYRERYHPSPVDWRNEVLYFLLVDRFSDASETDANLLQSSHVPASVAHLVPPFTPSAQTPVLPSCGGWDGWCRSGYAHWQGGTIRGVTSKLDYLRALGVTALWVSPVFRQRLALGTYHGYGIQDFLDVDPRFGTRAELVALVEAAHACKMRVILDIVFNHTGCNWLYPGSVRRADFLHFAGRHPFGSWLAAGETTMLTPDITERDDGVWPRELQSPDAYTRAGTRPDFVDEGCYKDDLAPHKRADFDDLRDVLLSEGGSAEEEPPWVQSGDIGNSLVRRHG